MYNLFEDYTEVNLSKPDKPAFFCRVKKFLYDPKVEGEAMKELYKKATNYFPLCYLNESSTDYSMKLKKFGKWLWRNKGKIIGGALIAGGLAFLSYTTTTVRDAFSIPEAWALRLNFNPILHPITHYLGEGEVIFSGERNGSQEICVLVGNKIKEIVKNRHPLELIRSYIQNSILRHLPLYLAEGEVISFGVPYIWKKFKGKRGE